MPRLGLKIDVDTYCGMKNGVPRLLRTLDEFNLKGTFFLSIGPDNSGRAVLQLIKNPLFLKKMMKTKAASLYGWRTALYGTLLPAPMIALSFPDLVREILDKGHEVQFHAWDHRRWQDELTKKSDQWIEKWFESGIEGYRKLTGQNPTAFGAPSWFIDERVLRIISRYHFEYLSCTRARMPFIHETIKVLEIPSDLPCFEELDAQNGVSVLRKLSSDGQSHVLPVHAEVEGGIYEDKFKDLLKNVLTDGLDVVKLIDLHKDLINESVPVRKHKMALLAGRHSPCAV